MGIKSQNQRCQITDTKSRLNKLIAEMEHDSTGKLDEHDVIRHLITLAQIMHDSCHE